MRNWNIGCLAVALILLVGGCADSREGPVTIEQLAGANRFDHFSIVNMTNQDGEFVIAITKQGEDPDPKTHGTPRWQTRGEVLVEDWLVTQVECTVGNLSREVEVPSDLPGFYINSVTFWYHDGKLSGQAVLLHTSQPQSRVISHIEPESK